MLNVAKVYILSLLVLFCALTYGDVEEGYYRWTNDRDRNPTPGGLVSEGAYVEETVFISPKARIEGSASVTGSARIYGTAVVRDDATVGGRARVYGNALVCDNATIEGSAKVYGNALVGADATVGGNAKVYGDALVLGNAIVDGKAAVFEMSQIRGDSHVGGTAKIGGYTKAVNKNYQSGVMKEKETEEDKKLRNAVIKRISKLAEYYGDYGTRIAKTLVKPKFKYDSEKHSITQYTEPSGNSNYNRLTIDVTYTWKNDDGSLWRRRWTQNSLDSVDCRVNLMGAMYKKKYESVYEVTIVHDLARSAGKNYYYTSKGCRTEDMPYSSIFYVYTGNEEEAKAIVSLIKQLNECKKEQDKLRRLRVGVYDPKTKSFIEGALREKLLKDALLDDFIKAQKEGKFKQ